MTGPSFHLLYQVVTVPLLAYLLHRVFTEQPQPPSEHAYTAEELREIGQLFMMEKTSLILNDDSEIEDVFAEDDRFFMTEPALSLVNVPANHPNSSAMIQERLVEHGAVLIKSLANRTNCKIAAEAAHRSIMRREYPFGNIMETFYRKDMPLLLEEPYLSVLDQVIQYVYPALSAIVGPDASLEEYSTLTSYPGAASQSSHHDAGMMERDDLDEWRKLYSGFVYLDDVEEDMAALDVWLATHTHFHFITGEELQMMFTIPSLRMAVPAGSVVLYDSRLLHRGSGNTSKRTRPTLYFSILGTYGEKDPEGPTYSLRKEYKDRKVTLRDLVNRNYPSNDWEQQHEQDKERVAKSKELCNRVVNERCRRKGRNEPCDSSCSKQADVVEQCGGPGILEMVCQQGIYAPDYKVQFSWGPATP